MLRSYRDRHWSPSIAFGRLRPLPTTYRLVDYMSQGLRRVRTATRRCPNRARGCPAPPVAPRNVKNRRGQLPARSAATGASSPTMVSRDVFTSTAVVAVKADVVAPGAPSDAPSQSDSDARKFNILTPGTKWARTLSATACESSPGRRSRRSRGSDAQRPADIGRRVPPLTGVAGQRLRPDAERPANVATRVPPLTGIAGQRPRPDAKWQAGLAERLPVLAGITPRRAGRRRPDSRDCHCGCGQHDGRRQPAQEVSHR